jgi:aryl-alcohol dehydrogenase-like predicted oxidoreductase
VTTATVWERIPLGKTGIQISPIGIGAWSWGDRFFWGYGTDYSSADVQEAFDSGLENGVTWFDTAELYGLGTSERLLGELIHRDLSQFKARSGLERPLIATKFMPFPWRNYEGALFRGLRQSLERLNLPAVDLYQIHFPVPPLPVETWARWLAEIVEAGLARAVGVSNFSSAQMRRSHTVLEGRGIPLASNQVEYSLLNRKIERNGVLDACLELGATPIAYSPLGKGLLSGKYSPENPPPGLRGLRFNPAVLKRIQPLVGLLREIGVAYDKTPSQVALNWAIVKGTAPIPGAKNARQARENAGAMGWRLSPTEVELLDRASSLAQV